MEDLREAVNSEAPDDQASKSTRPSPEAGTTAAQMLSLLAAAAAAAVHISGLAASYAGEAARTQSPLMQRSTTQEQKACATGPSFSFFLFALEQITGSTPTFWRICLCSDYMRKPGGTWRDPLMTCLRHNQTLSYSVRHCMYSVCTVHIHPHK